jgi:hypothetical protein
MKKNIIALIFILSLFCFSEIAFAAECKADPKTGELPKPGSVCLDNPLGDKVDATEIIGGVIRVSLGILGSVSLLMLVWGGFQWLTSAGNTEKIEKGTNTMIWAVIGVLVVLSSYILVSNLTEILTTK